MAQRPDSGQAGGEPRETVPACNLQRQAAALRAELMQAAGRVVLSGHYVLGPEVRAFEDEIAAFLGVPHAIGVGNGTDALRLALRALGVGEGDLVLTTAFTYFATISAICNCGATPILADIEPESYNLAPDAVERVLAGQDPVSRRLGLDPQRIKAVVPVHLYGNPVRMDALLALTGRYELKVVEDAAQCMGTTYRGRHAGALGDVGCHSFFPSKNLGACGDAGLVTTRDRALADKVSALRQHGAREKYHHAVIGTNSRLDALQAALLRVKLPHLPVWLEARRQHAQAYDARLADVPGLSTPAVVDGGVHSYHQYTLRVAGGRRDALQAHLKSKGIGSKVYYPVPVHLQQALGHAGYRAGDFPVAEQATQELLSLPMFPELTAAERALVIREVRAFCGIGV